MGEAVGSAVPFVLSASVAIPVQPADLSARSRAQLRGIVCGEVEIAILREIWSKLMLQTSLFSNSISVEYCC